MKLEEQQAEGLMRVIGVRTLAFNAVNLTVGAGIFTLPAVVAAYLGSAGFIAYLFCAVLITLVMLCFIESGSKVVTSGGAYVYIEKAFGPFVGFLTSTLFWLGYCVMADAAVANMICDNAAAFFPIFKQYPYRIGLTGIIFFAIAFLNVRGVKQGATLMEIITLSKMIPLLVLIVVGAFYVEPQNLVIGEWPSLKSIGEVSLILFFAFGGTEASLNASGEIKNPTYTVPRGILLGVFIVFLFYLSIHLVAQGVLGDELALRSDAPLATVAGRIMGGAGTTLLLVGAVLSGLGLISGDILVTSRLPYAAARDGLLPSVLSKVHTRFATPHIAIAMYASVGFILAISGGFRQLAVMASAALLCVYIGVILATIKLRKMKVDNSFSIPGGLILPIVALLATGWFLSNLSQQEILLVILFLIFCSLVYGMMRWLKVK